VTQIVNPELLVDNTEVTALGSCTSGQAKERESQQDTLLASEAGGLRFRVFRRFPARIGGASAPPSLGTNFLTAVVPHICPVWQMWVNYQ